ncbi:MAG TPA: leucyl/phenylalanyl-tRNA--protein transferase [Xanthomonadaceae bacterium]|jgi:leucyl/phenylalanyl-tRNA--protein transferase|nr:leucyl/phenylalanyl-tRNA--protein transferase [Xanthomonadaceae bacterium]
MRPLLLGPDPSSPFPPAELALDEPDGLVCIGGDLSPTRLVNAYAAGLFPWFSEGQPILWWSPSERLVFRSDAVRLSTRFRRALRSSTWEVRFDTAFDAVIEACAVARRPGQDGTWITPAMQRAYAELHRLGHAHSVEVWDGERLVGGLYGVSVGEAFHAESMFSAMSGGSKVALAALGRHLAAMGWPLFDAQIENPHLRFMGGEVWPRARFLATFRPRTAGRAPCPGWPGAPFATRELAG